MSLGGRSSLLREMTWNQPPPPPPRGASPARAPGTPRGQLHPATILVFDAPIARADIPGLCERVGAMLQACEAGPLVLDVGAITDPDAVTVEALARLQLTARRLGRRVRFQNACRELRELVDFVGLSGVVPCEPALPVEVERQAEQGEQVRSVQEEGDPGDPVA
jgi:hypothetical protein